MITASGSAERPRSVAAVSQPSTDFYAIEELLEPEEIEIRDRVRAFCEKEVTPRINDYWERAEFPFELVPKIAELGISGGTVEGYGSPGMSAVAAGLVAAEWARADGSVGTFYGVHSFLAMQSIALLGVEEQRERWLPEMARMEKIGAFGLTEPQHGSDAVGLETSARRDGDALRAERAEEVDRQRLDRRLRDHLGPRRGRRGRRLRRREGHPRLRGAR